MEDHEGSALSRRHFLMAAASPSLFSGAMVGGSVAQAAEVDGAPKRPNLLPGSIPVSRLADYFDVETDIHNLENGYWGVMSRPVAEHFVQQTLYINRANSIWARNVLTGGTTFSEGGRAAREAIARTVGAGVDEIAVARSGAEALNALLTQYRLLKAGTR